MAKKIKFPLEMRDGVQARTLEELQENFDIEKAMGYLLDGKLQTWLSDRYYIQEAELVGELNVYAADTKGKLYTILGIDKPQEENGEIDIEAIERRKQRLLKLKQYTDDESIWDKVDVVACDQEDLADLLDEECETIYLCGEKFQVPYSVRNVSYIGVNKPEVFVNATGKIDLEAQGISFDGVKILNDNIETGEELYQLGLSYLWERNGKEYDIEKAIEYFEKGAKKGFADAIAHFLMCLEDSDGYEKHNITKDKVKELLENSIKLGSTYAINLKAVYLWSGKWYEQDIDKAKELIVKAFDKGEPSSVYNRHYIIPSGQTQEEIDILKKGVELKSAWAANTLGNMYYVGNELIAEDKKKAFELYGLSIEFEETGYPSDGWGYRNYASGMIYTDAGLKKDVEQGITYLKKGCRERYADGVAGTAAEELALLFWKGQEVEKNVEVAYRYAELGRTWGSALATCLAGIIQCEAESMRNVKEGAEKLLQVANEDFVINYALDLVKNIVGDKILAAQIAQGGFYYVVNERPDEPFSIEDETRVYFISFDDIYAHRINRKRILTWNADILMVVPECKTLYYDNRVYLAMATLNEGIFCVINTYTKEVEDRRRFDHNSLLGKLEMQIEKEKGNVRIMYGTSGGNLNTYNCN